MRESNGAIRCQSTNTVIFKWLSWRIPKGNVDCRNKTDRMEDSLSEIINLDKEIVLHIKHIYEGSTYVWRDAELGVFSWRDAG